MSVVCQEKDTPLTQDTPHVFIAALKGETGPSVALSNAAIKQISPTARVRTFGTMPVDGIAIYQARVEGSNGNSRAERQMFLFWVAHITAKACLPNTVKALPAPPR